MIALAPKMYTCSNLSAPPLKVIKAKGVKLSQNPLTTNNYQDVLTHRTIKKSENSNLQLHKGVMSKVKISKNILTAAHTKYKVTEDNSTCIHSFSTQKMK
jgi:hypothetical protein